MRRFSFFATLLVLTATATFAQKPADDATKKLGAFLGKWESEATLGGGGKVTSKIDCRWSPQASYLICEQQVKTPDALLHQLTVYSYDAGHGAYSFATFQNPGTAPHSDKLKINGNTWIYSGGGEANGKKLLFRTTNEFKDSGRTETFKAEISNDDGATWTKTVEGVAHKVSD